MVHAFIFHIAPRSLLHHSQVGLIYSVTPCLVGCVRMDSVLGSAGKTKPAALSPLSLSVSINQPLFPSPLSAPPHHPSVSSPLFFCSNELSKKYIYINHTTNIPLACLPSDTHTKAHTHTRQDMRKWLGEALMGRPYVQALYISRLAPSALPDHHNLVCLQHKVLSKLGWVH